MCLQKFKTTVFVPKLSHFTEIVEIDVDPHDSELDVRYKLFKKLGILKNSNGYLLSSDKESLKGDWSRLITYEALRTRGFSYA
jgi:hypothetical protein